MTSLKHKTISGIKWTFAASIAQRIISFGTTVILARILSPADFGLFALAFVMIDAFGVFKSLGFDSALVRRKGEDIEKACNTAFFLIPAMGMILFVILFFFAPISAKLLNNPHVVPIIRALAIVFVISTFGKVPQTILYRNMKFKYKSTGEVFASITYCVVALLLALNKFGVWSLVVAYIAKTLIQVSFDWYFSGWKPKFEFDKTIAWDMFHFGKYVLAGGIVGFIYSNSDNIFIGKLLGITMLGYYAIAMNAANFLSMYFMEKVGMVMYPAYSKIQEDPDDVKRVLLKTLKYISVVSFPFCFILIVFASDILRAVFGQKWLPATNILRILAFVGMIRSFGAAIWPAFLARGKSKIDFQINVAMLFVFLILVVPLTLKFKLVGASCAVLSSSLISFSIGLTRVKAYLRVEPLSVFKSIGPAFLCSLLILPVGFVIKSINFACSTKLNFLISIGVSILVYLLINYSINKNIMEEIKEAFV